MDKFYLLLEEGKQDPILCINVEEMVALVEDLAEMFDTVVITEMVHQEVQTVAMEEPMPTKKMEPDIIQALVKVGLLENGGIQLLHYMEAVAVAVEPEHIHKEWSQIRQEVVQAEQEAAELGDAAAQGVNYTPPMLHRELLILVVAAVVDKVSAVAIVDMVAMAEMAVLES